MIVPCRTLEPWIIGMLADGSTVRMTVTGKSMQPFIRGGDAVVLESTRENPVRVGDVVLARCTDGDFVLHRVIRVGVGGCLLSGDAQRATQGPLSQENIIARIRTIIRGQKEIRIDQGFPRSASRLWVLARPLGPIALACAGHFRRAFRRTLGFFRS